MLQKTSEIPKKGIFCWFLTEKSQKDQPSLLWIFVQIYGFLFDLDKNLFLFWKYVEYFKKFCRLILLLPNPLLLFLQSEKSAIIPTKIQ